MVRKNKCADGTMCGGESSNYIRFCLAAQPNPILHPPQGSIKFEIENSTFEI